MSTLAVNREATVSLRPVVPSDYDEIYRWSTHPSTAHLWRYRGATPPPDMVVRQLWEGVTAQYCVQTSGRRGPAGLVGLYNSNHISRYCYLFALSAPESMSTGTVVRGALQLLDYAFPRFQLRKVYLESLESSLAQFKSAVRVGLLVEEGRLAGHEWNGSHYEDLVFLSMSEERWSAHRDRYFTE